MSKNSFKENIENLPTNEFQKKMNTKKVISQIDLNPFQSNNDFDNLFSQPSSKEDRQLINKKKTIKSGKNSSRSETLKIKNDQEKKVNDSDDINISSSNQSLFMNYDLQENKLSTKNFLKEDDDLFDQQDDINIFTKEKIVQNQRILDMKEKLTEKEQQSKMNLTMQRLKNMQEVTNKDEANSKDNSQSQELDINQMLQDEEEHVDQEREVMLEWVLF